MEDSTVIHRSVGIDISAQLDASSSDLAVFALKQLDPVAHLRGYVSRGIRFDGRLNLERRNVYISYGDLIVNGSGNQGIVGSATVRMGQSIIMGAAVCCSNKVTTKNTLDNALNFIVTLGPECSSKYEDRHQAGESIHLQEWLSNALCRSDAFDLSPLQAQNDTLLQLEVHLTVLSIDGNLKDSLLLAAIATIRDSKFTVKDDQANTQETTKIRFNFIPVSVNVAVFQDQILVDLTSKEEEIIYNNGNLVFDEEGSMIYSTNVFENEQIDVTLLKRIVAVARENATALRKSLFKN